VIYVKIVNTTQTFLQLREETDTFDLHTLDQYYAQYPEVFEEYFQYHCPRTEERLTKALKRYDSKLNDIQQVVDVLPNVIEEVMHKVAVFFGFDPHIEFYLLIGGFGSNAYVNRRIKGNVYFAVEKLSSNPDHLRAIVAHELGHIYHNLLLDQANIHWASLVWEDGTTSLYREGIATYLSQQTVPGLSRAVYFQYDDSGQDWLTFCKQHKRDIVMAFLADARTWTFDKEREWFRLSGGERFGHSRLGYYLGTEFVRYCVDQFGEKETYILWAKKDLKHIALTWLESYSSTCSR
jgi:hypothetical protein